MKTALKMVLWAALTALLHQVASAQDTIVLISGKIIISKSVEIKDYSVNYHDTKKGKFHSMEKYRIFSVLGADGKEQVLYTKDPYDSLDFTPEQMRLFIKGEQDADRFFHGTANKAVSFAIGVPSSLLAIYGLLVPPLYSTVIGSFSPNMQKATVSDPALRNVPEYSEGYQRKVREKKIRNSLLYGLAGFAAGFVVFNMVVN